MNYPVCPNNTPIVLVLPYEARVMNLSGNFTSNQQDKQAQISLYSSLCFPN